MTLPKNFSRRSFLSNASGAVGSGWLAAQWPAFLAVAGVACSQRDAEAGYVNIDEALGSALAAISEQIIPSDENSPGAREAGVVWFMDTWLGDGGKGMVPLLTDGVKELDGIAGGRGQFSQLPFDEQTKALRTVESGSFFTAVRLLTIVGMFAMPGHGGNQDRLGWKLIGFKDQHAWQPPFGYYDAEMLESREKNA